MSLSASDRKEIEEIVRIVFRQEFQSVSKDIAAGCVEAIDWYTDNLAQIFESLNTKNEKVYGEFREKILRMMETPAEKRVEGFKR